MLADEQPIATFHVPAALQELCIGARAAGRGPAHEGSTQVVHVRLASSDGGREAATMLLRKMYAWRGYGFEAGSQQLGHKITLNAEAGGRLVATMSLCLEVDGALPADENFSDRLDALRREGRNLCEPSRLAIERGVSKHVFAALIHISYIYARIHGCTDYVIEVNPRHVEFYKRMLGFCDFGAVRPCSRVGAPAVLLRLPLATMSAQIRRWGGTSDQDGRERSFYRYFFPIWDEPGITARLVAGINVWSNA